MYAALPEPPLSLRATRPPAKTQALPFLPALPSTLPVTQTPMIVPRFSPTRPTCVNLVFLRAAYGDVYVLQAEVPDHAVLTDRAEEAA